MSIYTAEQIASDYYLWIEYFDTGAVMTLEEYEATPLDVRIALIEDAYR